MTVSRPVETLPPAEDVRRARANNPLIRHVWDAAALGLNQGPGCAEILEGLSMGPEGAPEEQFGVAWNSVSPDPGRAGTTYRALYPHYVPFESPQVTRYRFGDDMARRALRAGTSHELVASCIDSPLGATALVAAAVLRTLQARPAGRVLEALSAVGARKGGEVDRLLPEYCVRNADTPEGAGPMAARDFWSSWYTWLWIRSADPATLDLIGSISCLATGVDYPDFADDAGGVGGIDMYLAGASEGLTCLAGKAATQGLRDLVTATAFMLAKTTMQKASAAITDLDEFITAAGGPPTHAEIVQARLWDGDVPPSYRMPFSTLDYRYMTDDLGTPLGVGTCDKMKRCFDNVIHSNDIIDIIPDYMMEETLNAHVVALAVRGGGAVLGVGDALARLTDDALECDCGESYHEEWAEMSMGTLLWYFVASRYVVRAHLACLTAAGGAIRDAFAPRPPGERLQQVARTVLGPGDTLYSPTWEPLWSQNDSAPRDPEAPWAAELADRAVARSVLDPRNRYRTDDCHAAARSVLADCDRAPTQADLRALAEGWCRFFDSVLDVAVTDDTARRQADTELRPVIARIWQQHIVGHDDAPGSLGDRPDEKLFIDFDHAMRRTFLSPPAEGLAVRRATLGVITSAMELSGINPYGRLADGVGRLLLDDAQTTRP